VASLDKNIFDQIDIDIVKDGSMYDKVEFVDFYRYFDISNEEMAAYLDEKDSYWKNLENRAAYSTDCKICQVGDYNHFKELGYHYAGSAKSWEKRLGLATIKEVKEDLKLAISAEEHAEFLKKLGYKPEIVVNENQKYICAYYVVENEDHGESECREKIDNHRLRDYLSMRLPDYMVPTYFIPMEKIPLTASGKINRKMLPKPELTFKEEYVAPRGVIEEALSRIWSEVLGLNKEKISIDANFFELGGHSLRATFLAAAIQKEFNVRIPLAKIFQSPTIRGQAGLVKECAQEIFTSIDCAEEKEYYILSSSQKKLYVWQQLHLDSIAYNMPEIIPLHGAFDIKKIEDTFKKLIKRHESLRTSFHMVDNMPVQAVHEEVGFNLDLHDFSDSRDLQNFIKQFVRPFDLAKAPLTRITLIIEADQHYILVVDMHHIISDGVSHEILIKDFQALYNGEALLPLRIQYKDFSEWQNGGKEKLKRQEEFWLKQFERGIPLLELPVNYPRPAEKSFEGDSLRFEFGKHETAELRKIALEENATLFVILLAIFNIFLSKISGQDDIIVGTSASGRTHADLEKIIGMFVNTLPLRNHPKGDITFKDFVNELKQNTVDAFDNRDYPFEDLVEKVVGKKDISRNPVFDVRLTLTNIEKQGERDLSRDSLPAAFSNTTSKFDLTWAAADMKDELLFSFEYCTKLFKEETVKRFINDLETIVQSVIKDREIKLKDIRISHDFVTVKSKISREDLEF
jgi:acyl carrier protein